MSLLVPPLRGFEYRCATTKLRAHLIGFVVQNKLPPGSTDGAPFSSPGHVPNPGSAYLSTKDELKVGEVEAGCDFSDVKRFLSDEPSNKTDDVAPFE